MHHLAAGAYATNQQFEANQWVADGAAPLGYSFLAGGAGGAPNIVQLANPGLRVSHNGLFAIEEADLTRRQPKHFFSTAEAIAGWNKILASQGSYYQLFLDPPGTVTFTLPGAAAPTTLTRVRAANLQLGCGQAGNRMTTTENCNGTVREVIGSVRQPRPRLGAKVFLGSNATQQDEFALHITNHLVHAVPVGDLPTAPPATWEAAQDLIARLFGGDTRQLAAGLPTRAAGFAAGLQTLGVNEFAQPTAVGQGLYSASLGASHRVGAVFAVHDYHNDRDVTDPVNVNRALWGFHWGGVVAMDGTDYLTLENYARNAENAGGDGDGLFYFQMYGAAALDTWHGQWTPPQPRGKGFANALSVVVEPDGQAGLTYYVANSKDTYAAVGAATTVLQLQRALLNGLNYANVHLYATSLTGEYADKTRRGHWRDAVANVLAAPPAFIDPTTTSLAQHVANALQQVK